MESKNTPRALLIVLDSVGVGAAPDAADYGDSGANTLGHIYEVVPEMHLPNLDRMGLAKVRGVSSPTDAESAWGRMRERSAGKDTTTGHWEIAGVILDVAFAVYDLIPLDLVEAIEKEAGCTFLGNYAQSGTVILEELGTAHVESGNPILYTSADSVLQIAAHEAVVPLDELHRICAIARRHADAWQIGRVIARPFEGEPGDFRRTSNRHDYSMSPPPTMLTRLTDAGIPVTGVGKISDIFAGQGITTSHPTQSNAHGMETISQLWSQGQRGLVFANLVDFDMLFGHRRDPQGYGSALMEFDLWLGDFLPMLHDSDLLIITADHGNDPVHIGTDHTREEVAILLRGAGVRGDVGVRSSFADVAATVEDFFNISLGPAGRSILRETT